MRMYAVALDELRARWRDGNHFVGKDDIVRWSELSGLSVTDVLDKLAVELASDFFVGFLGWEFVDNAANALFAALIDLSGDEKLEWPTDFDEFYLAFDYSEMRGPKDRELIRAFLAKHSQLTG
ncbi:hypothetical protein GCM10011411_25900 [Aurantiacibacter arachoides]|nr:hypothetical protein GCM10011411_25900 [Aurantiacibacter arachoides]